MPTYDYACPACGGFEALHPIVQHHIVNSLGWRELRPLQEEAIAPIRSGGEIIGVAVVKVRLEALEERWEKARLQAFVSDENSIIILSSDPLLRLKAVRPLSATDKERMARSLQYHWWALNEWQPLSRERLAEHVETLTFPAVSGASNEPVRYLTQTRQLGDTTWNFSLLTPMQDLHREALIHGMLAAVGFALLTILLIAWN